MPEFLSLLPPVEALQRLLSALPNVSDIPLVGNEKIRSYDALGRVTASPVVSPEHLPPFHRSTVDGFAVRAIDTFGSSESLPAYLHVIGEIPMGAVPNFQITPYTCALIHTGGMLPDGADSVVMIEYTQYSATQEIEIFRPVAVGENILLTGEDVKAGDIIIPSKTKLRSPEIGGLLGLGILDVLVARSPRVGILSTGDEVVAPEQKIGPGQIRDVNTYSLGALIKNAGGIPVSYGIVADNAKIMETTLSRALENNDLVMITAGSSASTRDLTSQVIQQAGAPGVVVHGVNVKPGKPTILAVCDGKPVIGLPGNPVSALVISYLFVVPIIDFLQGLVPKEFTPTVKARLNVNLSSVSGREDWIPVRLLSGPFGYQAEPIFGKSNLIFTLVRTDGLIKIPADATGLAYDAEVDVILL
jgi:molybdopterin molybdotransferase